MADELGHLSAEIALDINPFLNNQRVLEAQIKRTGNLINQMERSFKTAGSSIGSNSIFKTQIAQLKMLGKEVDNYRNKFDAAKKDLAANPTVDNERALGTTATNLQKTALQYDQVRLAAARTLQTQRAASSVFGQGSRMIGDYGNKLQSVAGQIRSFGSGALTAGIGTGFIAAAHSAMTFKSEIQAIGPLLSDDGRISAQVSQQLNSMSQSSLKWSQQYGISTTQINNAMTELVRRGFTAQQTLGSMPAILNASRASGEELGTVMQATASSIEMFGLKANTTSQQIKNTNRVTDVLTVAANKTASSFADISAAMTYVGPTAAQAHMSIEQVAAALGALSNKGIEASTAGTTLRQVLSKLTTDTPTNRKNMQAIGVDIDEIKKKGVDLPKLIDQINNKLKDKTPTEKMALLNTAFGKLGQGVMALFEKSNKSSKSAGQELKNLQDELENAGGTTKRIADEMNNTPEAKWQRFLQTLKATAIEIGGNVLPAFEGVLKPIQNLAQAFGKLLSSQQQAIVSMLAFTAAIKPLSSLVAAPISGLGKLENAFKKVYDFGAKLSGGSLKSAISDVDKLAGTAGKVESTASSLEKMGTAALSAGSNVKGAAQGFATIGEEVGGLSGMMSSAETALAGVGTAGTEAAAGTATLGSSLLATGAGLGIATGAAVVAAGAFVLIKNNIAPAISAMVEHQKEVNTWGSDIGKQTSDTAGKFKDFSTRATNAMNEAKNGVKANTDEIKDSFKGMAKAAEDSAKQTDDNLKKFADGVGGGAGALAEKYRKENAKQRQADLTAMQEDEKLEEQIVDTAAKNGGKISDDSRQYLNNIQADMTDHFVKTLNTSNSTMKAIQESIAGTFKGKVSDAQYTQIQNGFDETLKKSQQHFEEYRTNLEKNWKSMGLSHKQYLAMKKEIDREDSASTQSVLEGQINFMRSQGMSWSQIEDYLKHFSSASDKDINAAVKNIKKGSDDIKSAMASVNSSMSKDAKEAGDSWNKLVFDPKTGKIKTNAKDAIADMAKTDKGWKQLKFITKNAKLGVKGKQLLVEGIVEAGKWNKLSFKEQLAVMATKGDQEVAKQINKMGEWNKINPKVQQIIATAPNQGEMVKQLALMDQWNGLPTDVKNLFVNSSDAQAKTLASIMNMKQWNSLPTQVKNIIANNMASGATYNALQKVGQWNNLPTDMKDLIVHNMTGKDADPALTKIKGWNKLSAKQQTLAAQDYASGKIKTARNEVKKWAKQSAGKAKNAKAKDNASGPAKRATDAVKNFSKLKDHTVTLTTKYVTEHITKTRKKATGTAGAWRAVPHFAHGTPNDGWEGGPVIVGDGHRREVVSDPELGLFTTPATDTLMNLNRGAVIWRSVEAFQNAMWHAGIKDYPHFANGSTNQSLINIADRIPDNTSDIVNALSDQGNSQSSSNLNATQKETNELIATLIEQNAMLVQLFQNMGMSLNIDGKQFAKMQVGNNSNALSEYVKRTGMGFS